MHARLACNVRLSSACAACNIWAHDSCHYLWQESPLHAGRTHARGACAACICTTLHAYACIMVHKYAPCAPLTLPLRSACGRPCGRLENRAPFHSGECSHGRCRSARRGNDPQRRQGSRRGNDLRIERTFNARSQFGCWVRCGTNVADAPGDRKPRFLPRQAPRTRCGEQTAVYAVGTIHRFVKERYWTTHAVWKELFQHSGRPEVATSYSSLEVSSSSSSQECASMAGRNPPSD